MTPYDTTPKKGAWAQPQHHLPPRPNVLHIKHNSNSSGRFSDDVYVSIK